MKSLFIFYFEVLHSRPYHLYSRRLGAARLVLERRGALQEGSVLSASHMAAATPAVPPFMERRRASVPPPHT